MKGNISLDPLPNFMGLTPHRRTHKRHQDFRVMKKPHRPQKKGLPSRAFTTAIALTAAVTFIQQDASAAVLAVDLGTAANFAILAGTGVTINGTPATMQITGDIGTYTTITVTGLENSLHTGVNHAGDSVTQQAKIDLAAAIADASGRTPTTVVGPIYDFGGYTLAPGVYNGSSSIFNTGTLTLDASGDPNAVWIFQAGSTLNTSANSSVLLIGGAQASNVFWQVGTSVTLGTDSTFFGTMLASDSITLNSGADLIGRALAQNGSVTLNSNIIVIPEPSSTLLFATGLLALVTVRSRSGK